MIDALAGRLRTVRDSGERGFVALYVVVVTLGLVAMSGLVIDGGSALAAREQAADAAQQAARAGADALAPDSLRSAGSLRAMPAAATQAATAVLATGGLRGSVIVDGDTVTVTVVVHKPTTILSAVGLTTISGSATETATAIRGSNTAGSD